jgi:tetratricopeptide (TPR) repeat protein
MRWCVPVALACLGPALMIQAPADAHPGHGPEPVPSRELLARAAALPTPLLRGKEFYRIGAMDRAMQELTAAVTLDTRSVEAYRFRAMTHSHERRHQEAFADFEAALALDPPPPELYEVHYYYGDALFNAGIYDQAARRFEILLGLKPDHVDARCYLGETLVKQGRREEAERAFRKALEIDPKSAWAHHSLGDLLASLGRDEAAAAEYRADLQLVPHCQTARLALARALSRMGRALEALNEYYTSLAYHLGDPEAHNGMARIFWAQGEYERAYAEYARTLDFDPKNEEARRGLEEARRMIGSGPELIFWRFVGSWVPAALVALGFIVAHRRRRSP